MNDDAALEEEWRYKFRSMSDLELVKCYNCLIGMLPRRVSRNTYTSILFEEMLARGWDHTEITLPCPITGKTKKITFDYPIRLVNKKIIPTKNYFWFNNEKYYLN